MQHDAAQDERRRLAETRPQPINLPEGAYGPRSLEFGTRVQVWAWVPFTDGRHWRLPGEAAAWNDRVVQFEWWSLKGGGTRSTTVWRQAVRVRTGGDHNCDHFLPWMADAPNASPPEPAHRQVSGSTRSQAPASPDRARY